MDPTNYPIYGMRSGIRGDKMIKSSEIGDGSELWQPR